MSQKQMERLTESGEVAHHTRSTIPSTTPSNLSSNIPSPPSSSRPFNTATPGMPGTDAASATTRQPLMPLAVAEDARLRQPVVKPAVSRTIKDWPASERPREKLLHQGATALSDAELLAIFLRTGVKGKSAVSLARELLQEFGSLRALLAANAQQFCAAHGLGEAKYVQLQAVVEMSRRFLAERLLRGAALTSPDETRAYLVAQLRDEPHEVFALLMLDNQHRVLRFEPLFYGTIDSASVYPRVVVKKVLERNAAAVILAHNHPSGIAEPSQADRHITTRLQAALKLIDVRVLDHMVVGDGEVISFAERGWV